MKKEYDAVTDIGFGFGNKLGDQVGTQTFICKIQEINPLRLINAKLFRIFPIGCDYSLYSVAEASISKVALYCSQ